MKRGRHRHTAAAPAVSLTLTTLPMPTEWRHRLIPSMPKASILTRTIHPPAQPATGSKMWSVSHSLGTYSPRQSLHNAFNLCLLIQSRERRIPQFSQHLKGKEQRSVLPIRGLTGMAHLRPTLTQVQVTRLELRPRQRQSQQQRQRQPYAPSVESPS